MSDRRPLVSVIVLTYNQQDTIARALDSALMQTCDFDYEIVISDDCSADATPDICRRYAINHPDKIRFIQNSKNKGLVDNYFDTLETTRGEIIADLAGDDCWYGTNRLSLLVSALQQHPDVCMVASRYFFVNPEHDRHRLDGTGQWINEPLNPRATLPADTTPRLVDTDTVLHSLIHSPNHPDPFIQMETTVFRRQPLMAALRISPTLFRNSGWHCEDLQIIAAEAAAGQGVLFVDVPTLLYTVGGDSLTSTADPARLFDLYFGTTRLKYRLAETYGIDLSRHQNNLDTFASYLAMQAFASHSSTRTRAIRTLAADRLLHLNAKSRTALALSRYRTIYNLVMPLYRIAAKIGLAGK